MDRILSLNTATLAVDFSQKFLLITWHGKVNFDDYKSVLIQATEITKVHGIQHVVINRLDLQELSTECRVWMKNHFLKKLVKPIIPMLSKVATIEAKSAIGQIYSNTISKTVSLVYPNLTFKSFSSESDAYKWINPKQSELVPEPVLVGRSRKAKAPVEESRAPIEPVKTSEPKEHLEQRRNKLLDSLYQLFFGAR